MQKLTQTPKRFNQCFGLTLATLLLLFTLSVSVYANGLNDWQKPKYIQKAFNEIALKNEYRSSQLRILKWHQPINYHFQYHQIGRNLMVEQLFHTHLKQLSQITNLPITHTNISNQANLVIHLTADINYKTVIQKHTPSRVKDIATESNCMGSFTTSASKEITKGQIVLPLDHVFSRGLLVACIIEETTQLMGLPNDSDWVNPSIANDASKIEFLTGLDYLFLKILYSKQLKAGMNFNQSQPIITKIIGKLQKSKEIEKASSKVNQQGLNPLVN